ncbi:MAG: hypothetical protein H7312_15075 [Tardiphaga sp.]|nr:hypothetical protein [Tardiphaga sp.]
MFEYAPPLSPSEPAARAQPAAEAARGFHAIDLARLLTGRIITIGLAAIIGTGIAVAIGKSLTARYSATAQLYVDPRELQLVERELTPRSQDLSGLAMVVESQARLITSNNVLSKVIGDLNLEQDSEFGGKSAASFLSGLLNFGSAPSRSSANEKAATLEALRMHVNVKRTDRTFIVDIDVWSREPAKAAAIANALAESYLEESKDSQAVAARRATADLSGRLKELQERLRTAENNLAVYKSKNNFLGTQDTQVSDQQLSSGTQRLANAQAATLDALARYNQIEASRKIASDGGAVPEALQSPTIASLRTQYADARRKQAELMSELGPLHPALRMASKQVEDLRRNIDEEVDRFAQSAKNDLTRTRALEASLTKALDGQKKQSADLGQASVQLRELERDVEASRTIYQSFLKRSRETEEQETLNTSSARIIGDATAPQRRIFPPAMSVLAMLGFMLGAAGSIGWIVVADRLSSPAAPAGAAPDPVAPPPSPPLPPSPSVEPKVDTKLSPGLLRPRPNKPAPQVPAASLADAVRFSLTETDLLRTLNGIFPLTDSVDIVRLGWPTLRADVTSAPFIEASHRVLAVAKARAGHQRAPAIAVLGLDCAEQRTIVALNFAMALTGRGARVLLIDADRRHHALSSRLGINLAGAGVSRWISTTAQPSASGRSGFTIQSVAALSAVEASHALEVARASQAYDVVVLNGPALEPDDCDPALLGTVEGVIAISPAEKPGDGRPRNTVLALGDAAGRLVGIVVTEFGTSAREALPLKQYA